jgi:excisionase family DNA binding protein
MRLNGSPELALLVADPQRATELCCDQIPALLGALEQVRAALWIQMVRAAEPVEREAASAAGHELLTVPDAAAELRFTRGYVYEAVRRGELPAVRKGKYIRLRREDLEAWLRGQGATSLDGNERLPHIAFPRHRNRETDPESERARRVRFDQANSRSRAMTHEPRGRSTVETPGSM